MINNNYYIKYIRMKKKYLNLCNKLNGGGKKPKFFKKSDGTDNGKTIYFIANLLETSDVNILLKRFLEILNIPIDIISNKKLHFTILEIEFNNDYARKYNIFNNIYGPVFDKETHKYWNINTNLSSDTTTLFKDFYSSQHTVTLLFDSFKILGSSDNIDNKFITLVFKNNFPINDFREKIHTDIIQSKIKTQIVKSIPGSSEGKILKLPVSSTDIDASAQAVPAQAVPAQAVPYKEYYIYKSVNDEDIYAVPEYYYGPDIWIPHISLVKISELKDNNRELYDNIIKNKDNPIIINKIFIDILIKNKIPIDILNQIKFSTSIKEIEVS